MWITSLNSHSAGNYSGTKCRSQSTLLRFGQRTPTNRAHFLSRLYHQVGFALWAFDSVEFDSFDFFRVHKAVWLSGLPSYDKRNKRQL